MVEFDQMWFIFQHSLPCGPHISSIGVAALGLPWYRSSHPDPRKSPKLQIWPHNWFRYCFPAMKGFFQVGEQKIVRWCQIKRIWRVINQFKAIAIATTDLWVGALSWWNRTPLVSFPGRLRNVSSITFQSPEVLNIQCGFIWKETMQLVSGKVEFNACPRFIAVAQLLSQPMNFSVHPCISQYLLTQYGGLSFIMWLIFFKCSSIHLFIWRYDMLGRERTILCTFE